MKRFLECCCTDADEAILAQAGGASRIELCEDLSCGGLTPSMQSIVRTLESVTIPVNVLVRPRKGGFVYSEEEIQSMLSSIRLCRRLGVNGVVVGALNPDGSVDKTTLGRLITEAGSLHITFHRAFDECADPFDALEDIISLGCERLLTAGHAHNVNDGTDVLKDLVAKAAGRIVVMPGSGVRPDNIQALEAFTGAKEFHSSSHGPDGRTSEEVVSRMVHCE